MYCNEESLESRGGVSSHALFLRGLKNTHFRPQSWKLFSSPMLCMRHVYFHCSCPSPMHFCKYSFITFLPMKPPSSVPTLRQAQRKRCGKTRWLNKLMIDPVQSSWGEVELFKSYLLCLGVGGDLGHSILVIIIVTMCQCNSKETWFSLGVLGHKTYWKSLLWRLGSLFLRRD